MNKQIIPVAIVSLMLAGCTFAVAYAENASLATTDTTSVTDATTTNRCTDSDGINYFTRGEVKDVSQGTFAGKDRCLSETKLLEYTCKNDAWYATYYDCPNGCAEGACRVKAATAKTGDAADSDSLTDLPDGTLVKIPGDTKVYVIKGGQKVWIQTAEQFAALGYKWQDIKIVSAEKMKKYQEKEQDVPTVVKSKQDHKVYRLENGKLVWVPSVTAFNAQGLKWDQVTEIDTDASAQYQESKLIQNESGDIYYITASGKKILIVSGDALNAYEKEETSTPIAVSDAVASSITDVNLVKGANDAKIYQVENGKKKWIKTAEAFNRAGYRWEDVETVNDETLQSYIETQAIE